MVAGLAILGLSLGACTYSDGKRAGIITKFSHKGFICKSWEGELVMGGANTQNQFNQFSNNSIHNSHDGSMNTVSPNVFQFSVTDKAVVDKVQAKLDSGERAVLHYNQEILPPFCWRRTEYVIKDVQ